MTSADSARPLAYPAALGWRLLALLYDLLPMTVLLLVVSAISFWLHGQRTIENDLLFQLGTLLAAWLLVGGYFVASWRRGGQTIGMRPWRLQLLAADGRPASWRALSLRYLVASLTPGLCLLWSLLDSERRGLHDLATGTQLVRRER
jgi:uncharacterized RDD family membrane protein YckC